MKKKRYLTLLCGLAVMATQAQNIYDMESLGTKDLNGTARYVGMGGAMGALGADVSTMGSNPAATGLYRRSDFTVSGSLLFQIEGASFNGKGLTSTSFDNIGFVYSAPMESSSIPYFNLGFNYSKSKNFNGVLNSSQLFGSAGGATMTAQMADIAYYSHNTYQQAWNTPWVNLGYETYLLQDGTTTGRYIVYDKAYGHGYNQMTKGGIEQYDFNVSTNIKDKVFLGLTFSAYDVHRYTYSLYAEEYLMGGTTNGLFNLSHEEELSGSGYDIKFGAVIRPIDNSPFRFGLSVSTPTWYTMSYTRRAEVLNFEDQNQVKYDKWANTSFDYNYRTPWRFNLSLGHTVGNYLALGAEYEYADLSSVKVGYGDVYNETDVALKSQAKQYLKGQSTFKLGAELKPIPEVALRVGYNYVSAPIRSTAYYNQFINSASLDYATTPSYMNVSDINRVTCGIGYRGKNVYVDLAYQYQKQTGDFYSFFAETATNQDLNELAPQKIKLDRSQLLLTLGFKF